MSAKKKPRSSSAPLYGLAIAFFCFCGIALYLADYFLIEQTGDEGPTPVMVGLLITAILMFCGIVMYGAQLFVRHRAAEVAVAEEEDFDVDAAFERYRAKKLAGIDLSLEVPTPTNDEGEAPPILRSASFGRKRT